MTRLVRISLVVAVPIGLVGAAGYFAWHALEADLCGNEVVARIASPDSSREAVVFERDCGATTGFSTQVSIIARGESLPAEAGNAFRSDGNHGAVPAGPGGGPALDVHWLRPNLIQIRHDPAVRVFRTGGKVHGVGITDTAVASGGV